MNFAFSIPDFRRTNKGNIRHGFGDIIMLMILARMSKYTGRADIIEFGKLNLKKLKSIGLLRNGIPSEQTLCRVENEIDELGFAEQMAAMCGTFHDEIAKACIQMEIICIDGKAMCGCPEQWSQPRHCLVILLHHRYNIGNRGVSGEKQ